MFGQGKGAHRVVSPGALADMMRDGRALVVDVREPDEFAAGHIPGAINVPLSSFHPNRLPPDDGRVRVLNCLGGKRSGMALDRCRAANAAVDTHLAGGFGAWVAAGMPVER